MAARRLDVASYYGLRAAGFRFDLAGALLDRQIIDVNQGNQQLQINFDALGDAELLRISDQLRAQLSVIVSA